MARTKAVAVTRKVGVYCRISKDRDKKGTGVDRQERTCRRICEEMGWEIVGFYEDNDKSASRFGVKVRVEFVRMIEDLRDGTINAVVVYDSDRLTRIPRELEDLIEMVEVMDIEFRHDKGEINLVTDEGRHNARQACINAARESDATSRRYKELHLDIAEDGRPSGGGKRPYGYDDDQITLRPAEAAVVRSMADRVLAGASMRSVALWLAKNEIPSPTGRPTWEITNLKRMLTSARIAGLREHHTASRRSAGNVKLVGTFAAQWPAIITVDELTRLRAILLDPARKPPMANARKYLLTGLVHCARCDLKMVGQNRPTAPRYTCQRTHGCHACSARVDVLDGWVVERVLAAEDAKATKAARRKVAKAKARGCDITAEVDDLELRVAALADDFYVKRSITGAEFHTARVGLLAMLDEAKGRLATPDPLTAVGVLVDGPLGEAWDDLDIETQRSVLSALVVRVVVTPGHRGAGNLPLEDRVAIEWRD